MADGATVSGGGDAMATIGIYTEYITLGQALKLAGVIDTGGEVRSFLAETSIKVNGEHDNRRGRKLYPGDVLEVEGWEPLRLIAQERE